MHLYRKEAVAGLLLIACATVIASSQSDTDPSAVPAIRGISVVGPAVKFFDHTNKMEALNILDGAMKAWKSADGTVNLIMNSPEMYRLRGPDLRNLELDPNKVYSSYASGDKYPEDQYDFWHWFGGPYSLDEGHTFYTLTHSEWYPSVLAGGTMGPNGEGVNTNQFTVTTNLMSSSDGGTSWRLKTVNGNHVVAKEAFYWTGSRPSQLQTYLSASFSDSGGIDAQTAPIKEGDYYYVMGSYKHHDFTQVSATQPNAPIDRQGLIVMRSQDLTNPNNWEAWSGGSAWAPISNQTYKVFQSQFNGSNVNVWVNNLIYDRKAQTYIAVVTAISGDAVQSAPVGYLTTTSLANPSFSDYTPIAGVGDALNPDAFWPYTTMIDPESSGYNFEYSESGRPLLLWGNGGPLVNGHHLLTNRDDLYYAQLSITYEAARQQGSSDTVGSTPQRTRSRRIPRTAR